MNSENQIKKNLNKHLKEKNEEAEEKYGVKITSETISVENTDDPGKYYSKLN